MSIICFLFVLIFSFIKKSDIINTQNVISLIITIFINYLLLTSKVSNDYSKMEYQNNKLKIYIFNKYPYLKEDIHIIDCTDKLQNLSLINELKFNTILNCFNKFHYNYTMSKQYNLKPNDIYLMR